MKITIHRGSRGKNSHWTEENSMFQMDTVGRNISRLRKAAGMTQMGLADAMGVSFQAVSNWERGQSCPDIAKLGELSRVFNVSIDELLGNERAAAIAENLNKGEAPVPPMELKEVEDLAPLMRPDQVDAAVGDRMDEVTAGDVGRVAPYMSEEGLDGLAELLLDSDYDLDDLVPLAPFLERETLTRLAEKAMEDADLEDLAGLAPFLGKETLGKLAATALSRGADLDDLAAIAPFMGRQQLDEAVRAAHSIDDLDDLVPLAPFMSRDTLTELVGEALRSGKADLDDLVPLMPFLKTGGLRELLRHE